MVNIFVVKNVWFVMKIFNYIIIIVIGSKNRIFFKVFYVIVFEFVYLICVNYIKIIINVIIFIEFFIFDYDFFFYIIWNIYFIGVNKRMFLRIYVDIFVIILVVLDNLFFILMIWINSIVGIRFYIFI